MTVSSTKTNTDLSLSALAIEKLASSGISPEEVLGAGLYSVENAREEVHHEFAARPALVFSYFNLDGSRIFFEKDGESHAFIRIRYLNTPRTKSSGKAKLQRYAQLQGSSIHPYFPPVFDCDWADIANDTSIALGITEGELKALKACLEGFPTIGITGVDCFRRKVGGA